MQNHQKRHWLRSYTDMPIWFAEKGEGVFAKGQLRNKSPAGACFISKTRFNPQTELIIRMKAPATGSNTSVPSFSAIVKWQQDYTGQNGPRYKIGVQFVN